MFNGYKKVFIGVGHGGKDPGAVGDAKFGGVVEKDANLLVALVMQDILVRNGVKTAVSRAGDADAGTNVELELAKQFGPDLAVEVHTNAGGGDGFEVWAQQFRFREQSHAAARAIERRVKELGQHSRGVKTKPNSAGSADYYAWLRKNDCPAVLCEGFFVDSIDALDFDTVEELSALGRAYALGVLDYFGIVTDDDFVGDSTPDDYAVEAVQRAIRAGVLRGDGKGDLQLHAPITRQDAIVMLHRCGAFS